MLLEHWQLVIQQLLLIRSFLRLRVVIYHLFLVFSSIAQVFFTIPFQLLLPSIYSTYLWDLELQMAIYSFYRGTELLMDLQEHFHILFVICYQQDEKLDLIEYYRYHLQQLHLYGSNQDQILIQTHLQHYGFRYRL